MSETEAVLKKLRRRGYEPTPVELHRLLQSGYAETLETLELFLQLGMAPDTRHPEPPRATPLMSALRYKRRPKVIARLLEAGANPALTDDHGHSAVAHLVNRFEREIPGRDTFAEVFGMLTAHPDVTPEDRALWSPGMTPWASFLRLKLRTLARVRPELAARLQAPAPDERITEVEKCFERSFPDVLRELYRAFDGMTRYHFLGGWQVLPLAELLEVSEALRGRKLGNDLGSRGYRNLTWSAQFIPFGRDNTGDILFTSPRMLGDRAIMTPADPTYVYRHDEDRVVLHALELEMELQILLSAADPA
jgi:SMI1 / KNR4 family (SUKH-1)